MDGNELKLLKSRGLRHPTTIAVHPIPFSNESHVYWVNSSLKRIEFIVLKISNVDSHGYLKLLHHEDLVPQHVAIAMKNIIVVGSSANGSSRVFYGKALVSGGGRGSTYDEEVRMANIQVLLTGLSQVTGLSINDDKSQM